MERKFNTEEIGMAKDDYNKRFVRWHKKTNEQLSFSNNFFLGSGIAVLGFILSRNKNKIIFCLCNAKELTFLLALISALLSVGCGFLMVLSRLYDFRSTCGIIKSRKDYLKEHQEKIADANHDTNTNSPESIFWKGVCLLLKLFFESEKELKISNYKDKVQFKADFDKLRMHALLLGMLSWELHKRQILFFSLSVFLIFISYFLN